jgi:hypothetical protein
LGWTGWCPVRAHSGPIDATLRTVSWVLPYIGFGAIAALLVKTWGSKSGPVPLISLLVLVANGVWWFILDPLGAFTVATVFHGVQYLAIVSIFHVKEQMAQPENQRGVGYHVLWFYGASLLLGYALFNCLPWGFDFLGFGLLQSVALVVVAATSITSSWTRTSGSSGRAVRTARLPRRVTPPPLPDAPASADGRSNPVSRIVFMLGAGAFILTCLLGVTQSLRSDRRLPAANVLVDGPAEHVETLLRGKQYDQAIPLRGCEYVGDRLPHERVGQVLGTLVPPRASWRRRCGKTRAPRQAASARARATPSGGLPRRSDRVRGRCERTRAAPGGRPRVGADVSGAW